MRDKVEIRAGVTITREEYEELHKAFNEPDTPKFGRWKPEDGEDCWIVSDLGRVYRDTWENLPGDHSCFALGNVYRTQEEAQNAADRQRAEVRLKDWAAANRAFSGSQPRDRRWVVRPNYLGKLEVDWSNVTRHPNEILFPYKEDAERFLEACRDDLNIFWGIG